MSADDLADLTADERARGFLSGEFGDQRNPGILEAGIGWAILALAEDLTERVDVLIDRADAVLAALPSAGDKAVAEGEAPKPEAPND